MKKPYYNQEERKILLEDNFNGDGYRIERAALFLKKSIGESEFQKVVDGLLGIINKQIEKNWYKSNGRRTL